MYRGTEREGGRGRGEREGGREGEGEGEEEREGEVCESVKPPSSLPLH